MTEQTAAPLTLEEKIAKSSQVAGLGYDLETQKLTVEFRNGNGFSYVYSNFPPDKWAELQAADSLGSHLYHHVTGRKGREVPYPFEKVDKATGEIVAEKS